MYTDPSGHIPEGECGFAYGGCGTEGELPGTTNPGGGGNSDQPGDIDEELTNDQNSQSLEDLGAPICGEMMGIDPLCAIETISWTYTDGVEACLAGNSGACGYVTIITGTLGLFGVMFYDMAVTSAGAACIDGDCTNEVRDTLRIAQEIQARYGGTLTETQSAGYRITWEGIMSGGRNLVLRVMEPAGKLAARWRLAVSGKSGFTADGGFSSDQGLTHFDITTVNDTVNAISTLIDKVWP